jgi:hypothetical protein
VRAEQLRSSTSDLSGRGAFLRRTCCPDESNGEAIETQDAGAADKLCESSQRTRRIDVDAKPPLGYGLHNFRVLVTVLQPYNMHGIHLEYSRLGFDCIILVEKDNSG